MEDDIKRWTANSKVSPTAGISTSGLSDAREEVALIRCEHTSFNFGLIALLHNVFERMPAYHPSATTLFTNEL